MCCMSETRLGQFTYEMGRFNTAAPLRTDCYQTPTIKFIVLCLQKQGHLIFKGLHQIAQYHAAQPRAARFQLEGFAWREAVITRALPEVSLLVLPSDGWRVLPADLQVYPPIWRAGGRLANTLFQGNVYFNTQDINPQVVSEIYPIEMTAISPSWQWVNQDFF